MIFSLFDVRICVLLQQVKARGNVENWLGLVEESMAVSLRKLSKAALIDFETKPRHEWATQHASQVHTTCLFILPTIMIHLDKIECDWHTEHAFYTFARFY